VSWHYFASKEAAVAMADAEDDSANVYKIDFDGPGWYLVSRGSQPCPRGCCYDTVFLAQPAHSVAYELREKVDGLAGRLKEARERERQPPPFNPRAAAPGFATEDVVALAQVVAGGEPDKAGVLADALQEAGYDGPWLAVLRTAYRPRADDWIHQLAQGISNPDPTEGV
jgi:hypothetical protein